jgi:hypothetical protein
VEQINATTMWFRPCVKHALPELVHSTMCFLGRGAWVARKLCVVCGMLSGDCERATQYAILSHVAAASQIFPSCSSPANRVLLVQMNVLLSHSLGLTYQYLST